MCLESIQLLTKQNQYILSFFSGISVILLKFNMNKHIILFFILLSLHGTKSLAQYISTVSYPDKNIKKSTETNDPSYRIASMISSESLKKHLYILASDIGISASCYPKCRFVETTRSRGSFSECGIYIFKMERDFYYCK